MVDMPIPTTTEQPPSTTDNTGGDRYLYQQRLQSTFNTTAESINIPWGDAIEIPPENGSMRIYFGNVNGVKSTYDFAETVQLGFDTGNAHVEILGLAETNLDWSKPSTCNTFSQRLRQCFRSHSAVFSSSTECREDTHYHPGGTASIVGGNWRTRVSGKGHDPSGMGRWSYITLLGKENTRVTLITAYQVCKDSITTTGPRTAFRQQWQALRRQGELTPEPRKAFIRDLKAFMRALRSDNHELILMLDANEHPNDRNSGLADLVRYLGLVDIHVDRHGLEGEPSTYIRGSQRIDFIWATPNVVSHVTKAGIEAFGDTIMSDHRGLWFDLRLADLLKGLAPQIANLAGRSFLSTNPKAVKEYRSHVKTYFHDHRITERLNEVAEYTEQTPSNEQAIMKKLNAIDRDITRAILSAEKRVGTKYSLPWSPALLQARGELQYWRLWLSELRTNKSFHRRRDNILGMLADKSFATEAVLPPTKAMATKNVREAQKGYRKARKDAKNKRQQFLEERAAAEALIFNITKEQAVRRIQAAEENRNDFAYLHLLMKKNRSSGLSHLKIPNESGGWTTILDQADITRRLIERNTAHFNQAHGTPFTIGPLFDMLGWSGTGEAADSVLDGTLDIDSLNTTEATKSILKNLKRKPDYQEIPQTIQLDEMLKGFRVWPEKTSTSPSGRNLSLMKSLLAYDSAPSEEDDLTDGERIFMAITKLTNMAIQREQPLERWRKVANAMIEKIPGDPRIDKLRIIHLYEADLNLAMGILWARRLIWHGERKQMFGSEQWGSRSGRRSIDVVFLKTLTYLIAQLTRTTLGTFDNDAKACYDRVIIAMSNLRSQQIGMPTSACRFMANFFGSIMFFLKTQMGMADEFYDGTEKPQYGTGQGFRPAPGAWLGISSLLFESMPEKAKGVHFTDYDRKHSVHRIMDGFVDDTTAWMNCFLPELAGTEDSHPTVRTIQDGLSETAQWWEELLHASGGKLELPKCFFYIVDWLFDNEGRVRPATGEEMGHPLITVQQSEDSTTTAIKFQESTDTHRTLGAMVDPWSTSQAERQRLMTKGKDFARLFGSGPLSRRAARKAYANIYLPSMGYPLPVATLTRLELHRIQMAPLSVLLPAMGFNRHMPQAIIHGPLERGGVGIRHLYVEQGSSQSAMLLRHLRGQTSVGTTLLICLKWYQRFSGMSSPPLVNNDRHTPHAEGNWILSVRDYLRDCNCEIHITGLNGTSPRRENDSNLMDTATNGKYTDSEVAAINRVRLHLQVEYLSEISTATGDRILPSLWRRRASTDVSTSLELWPKQPTPGTKTWQVWKQFLLREYCTASGNLRQRLGRWIDLGRRHWATYYDPQSHCIALRPNSIDASWTYHPIMTTSRRSYHTSSEASFQDTAPEGGIPVDPCGTLRYSLPPPIAQPVANIPAPATLDQYFSTLPEWEADILSMTTDSDPLLLYASLVQASKIYMVSDGGQIDCYGSFGWVIATEDDILIEGRGYARGGPMQSFRAEGYGRLSMLRYLHRTIEFFSIEVHPKCKLWTYCDNTSLLKAEENRVLNNGPAANPSWWLTPDCDVIELLVTTRRLLPPMKHAHVKGHQDDETPFEELPRKAQLNVHADMLATEALLRIRQQYHHESPPLLPLESCCAYLYHRGSAQTSKEVQCLRDSLTIPEITTYLCQRHGWTVSDYDRINWQAYGQAMKRLDRNQQAFVITYCIRWLPTGVRLHRYCKDQLSECHLCKSPETDNHLLQCPQRKDWQDGFLDSFHKLLSKLQTAADVRVAILNNVRSWLQDAPTLASPTYQDDIGWDAFMRGYIAVEWSHTMERFYRNQGLLHKEFNGTLWTQRVIRFLWTQIHTMWRKRCSDAHNPGEQSHSAREHYEAVAKTKAMYAAKDTLLANDRDLLAVPLQERLASSPDQLIKWVHATYSLVQKCAAEAAATARTGCQDLRTIFEPLARPAAPPREPPIAAPPPPPPRPRVQTMLQSFFRPQPRPAPPNPARTRLSAPGGRAPAAPSRPSLPTLRTQVLHSFFPRARQPEPPGTAPGLPTVRVPPDPACIS